MIVTGGGKNFVSAENVAHVVCNALEKGRSGERYLVAGVNLSFIEFFKHQRKLGGYKQWIIHIPDWALKCAGYVGDMVRKAGIETELCTMNIDQLLVQEYYTGEKAKRELDMKDTYLSESIFESLNWFKSTGKI
jgi:dihydroflavonol-4-reductase